MMVVGQNVGGLLFAMCITSWCGTARQMRGQLMQLRESEYVQAAQMIGASRSASSSSTCCLTPSAS